jgi:hypothetical protein
MSLNAHKQRIIDAYYIAQNTIRLEKR